jgi:hypothetical protein
MSRVPDERSSWVDDPDADQAVRDLRSNIAKARAVVTEHRNQAKAVGLGKDDDTAPTDPPQG